MPYNQAERILTPNEKQILTLHVNGLRLEDIAFLLGLHYNTVNNTVNKIFQKLGVHDLSHAWVVAVRTGIVPKDAARSMDEWERLGLYDKFGGREAYQKMRDQLKHRPSWRDKGG